MRFEASTSRLGILDPRAVGERFTLARHLPSDALAPFVERYWSVRWDLPEGTSHTSETLPHPAVNVVFEACGSAVHGIPARRFTRELAGRGKAFGVKFRPGAFSPFSMRPMHLLAGHSLPVAEVFGDAIRTVDATILEDDDDARSVARFESFLTPRLPPIDPEITQVVSLVRVALEDPALADVASFAARTHLTVRALQRLFRKHVGVSPKWVLRRFRIQEAAERVASATDVDFARLTHELGYADQSHFVRDFKAQVGRTPSAYAAWCARS